MSQAYKDSAPDWTPAIQARRRALMQRLGMGAAMALIFTPVFGSEVSALWCVGYFLVQALDLWIFAPVLSGRVERMGPIRSAAGNVMLFLNAASFGSLSVPLWLLGGPMGGVCAAIVAASGAIYGVINSPGSRKVLAITIAPHFLYMAAVPFWMSFYGASHAFVMAVTISFVVFGIYCVSTWERMNKAQQSESAARLEADRKRTEAERIMASRQAFLAAVGHDLRTPISAIMTGAAELEAGAKTSSARAQAALISDASVMMKALLDDLLDHAKLEGGHMTVESVDFNLRSLIAQTLMFWQGEARAKGLSLRVEGASSMPASVKGDPMRLRQVLNNLVSNAMKFTDAGSVTLRLASWPEEPAEHAILIEIADTGPGMSADQLARLFTPFDQLSEGVSARHGGSGLGLSISRDLIELMGGRLTARSRPGEGAVFTVSLVLPQGDAEAATPRTFGEDSRGDIVRSLAPRKPSSRAPRKSEPKPEPAVEAAPALSATEALLAQLGAEIPAEPVAEPKPAETPAVDTTMAVAQSDEPPLAEAAEAEADRPLRVLVVDDHDINRRAVELILAPLGCDIATAADGLAALAQCETGVFDVIFMDVRMPELDGRETTRRLRAGGGPNAGVPVIAVTADTAPEDIAACMAAGMTYFVSKPLTPPALLGALEQVLSEAEAAPSEVAAA
ncbi:ATP-binding protein [Brevundimonas bacteroides]|uniref:ATP-binding protein n=1 Tax=Brevundimonas bacteroides TaxID=74311 RepID=UPI0004954641|nr:ATP-binding protein [Brevundimonas bacteroides]